MSPAPTLSSRASRRRMEPGAAEAQATDRCAQAPSFHPRAIDKVVEKSAAVGEVRYFDPPLAEIGAVVDGERGAMRFAVQQKRFRPARSGEKIIRRLRAQSHLALARREQTRVGDRGQTE